MNYEIHPKKGWVVGWSEAKIEILYFYVFNTGRLYLFLFFFIIYNLVIL